MTVQAFLIEFPLVQVDLGCSMSPVGGISSGVRNPK